AWEDGRTQISWSPDGSRLAFDARDTSFPPGTCSTNCAVWKVFVVNVDGTSLRGLAVNSRAPAWSPTGRTIAFASEVQPGGESLGVTVARLDGSAVFRVRAYDDVSGAGPAWSPGGASLAFQLRPRLASPAFRIDLVRADGSRRRRLTQGRSPTWSPDGRQLAYVRNGRLFTLAANGHTARRLASSG